MTDWQNRIAGYGTEDPEQLLANPFNARIHPQPQQDGLQGVLDTVGWVDDVIVNKTTGHVVDGHLRVLLAMKHNEQSIPVKYVELTEDEEKLVLAAFDWITGLATYDRDALDTLLKDVQTDDTRLQAMLSEMAAANDLYFGDEPTAADDPGADVDRAAELQAKWQVQRNQVWRIGKHRLMCGDSTSAEDVARLMGGVKADAVVTDPPYGMAYNPAMSNQWSRKGDWVSAPKNYDAVIGDTEDFDPTFLMEFFNYCDEQFWWGADYYAERIPLKNNGSWLVWDKREGIEDVNYSLSSFELCWSKKRHLREIIRKRWMGVMGTETQDMKSRSHPTQKPTEVITWIIDKHCGQIIVDPFCGSGTTLVACEQTGRRGFGMEISPEYCSVILERLSQMNLSPELEA